MQPPWCGLVGAMCPCPPAPPPPHQYVSPQSDPARTCSTPARAPLPVPPCDSTNRCVGERRTRVSACCKRLLQEAARLPHTSQQTTQHTTHNTQHNTNNTPNDKSSFPSLILFSPHRCSFSTIRALPQNCLTAAAAYGSSAVGTGGSPSH